MKYNLLAIMVAFMPGISVDLLKSKADNTRTLIVLKDNRDLLKRDYVYEHILRWLYKNFEGAFFHYPTLFNTVKADQDHYIDQMLYLLIPSLWLRYFNEGIIEDSLSNDMILNAFFTEVGLYDLAKARVSYTNGEIVQNITCIESY